MEGVVSLLDAAHDQQVRALCAELAGAFGLGLEHLPPFPHFSYQIAPTYHRAGVPAALAALAQSQPPFTATTAGLALFPGAEPVIYLPLVRTAALSAFHQRVWDTLLPLAMDPPAYYHPDHWVPHITLILAGLNAERTAEAVRRLSARDLYWTIPINTLCFVAQVGAAQVIQHRCTLGR